MARGKIKNTSVIQYFGRISKLTNRTDKQKLAEELLDSKPFQSKATDHGLKYELLQARRN